MDTINGFDRDDLDSILSDISSNLPVLNFEKYNVYNSGSENDLTTSSTSSSNANSLLISGSNIENLLASDFGQNLDLRRSLHKPLPSIPNHHDSLVQLIDNLNKYSINPEKEFNTDDFNSIFDYGRYLLEHVTNLSDANMIIGTSVEQAKRIDSILLTDNLVISNEVWFDHSLCIKDCDIKIDIMKDINTSLTKLNAEITEKRPNFNTVNSSIVYYERLLKAYNVYEVPSLHDKDGGQATSVEPPKNTNNHVIKNVPYTSIITPNVSKRLSNQAPMSQPAPNSLSASLNINKRNSFNFINKFKNRRSISAAPSSISNPRQEPHLNNRASILGSSNSNTNSNSPHSISSPQTSYHSYSKSYSHSNSNSISTSVASSSASTISKFTPAEIKNQKFNYLQCVIQLKQNYGELLKLGETNHLTVHLEPILRFIVVSIIRFVLIDVLALNMELLRTKSALFSKV